MTGNNYQRKALKTAKYYSQGEQFLAGVLGISAEAGEVAGKIEKRIRNGDVATPRLPSKESCALLKELGDVLWFVTITVDALGYSLDACMEENIAKLADREERDVIHGDGDDR